MSGSIVELLVKAILVSICRIDASEMPNIPLRGPGIIILNHTNFLEVPLFHLYTKPRNSVGIVKKETWDQFLLGYLARLWKAIPVDRSSIDLTALKRAEMHLAAGGFIMIAPEGTRSLTGVLSEAHAGVISLAVRTGAPIIPVAHSGGEKFWSNATRIRRTPFRFYVGEPFRIETNGALLTRRARKEALSETMGRLALLLPRRYHGYYESAARQLLRDGARWTREIAVASGVG